jgi:hypothetical protein
LRELENEHFVAGGDEFRGILWTNELGILAN